MKRILSIALAWSAWGAAASVGAAPLSIAIDLDTTRLSGTDTSGALVTQPGFTSWNVTNLGTSGTTIVEQGVTFELFGLAATNQSRVRPVGDGSSNDDLLQDLVFNEGATGRAIGLRISGLPVGAYAMQTWHYDSTSTVTTTENFVQIEVRNTGEASPPPVVDNFPFGGAPASFFVSVTAAGQVKEVIVREDDAPTTNDPTDQNRSRLNGFTLVSVPEPSGLALTCVCAGAGMRRRRATS